MNISLAFELQGPVTADLVARAWALIQQEFPYFASTIHQDEYGQLRFNFPSSSKVRIDLLSHASRYDDLTHIIIRGYEDTAELFAFNFQAFALRRSISPILKNA